MVKQDNNRKLEGIGGWIYLYFVFCAFEVFFLYGFIGSTYNSLASGEGGAKSVFLFILAVLQVILLVSSSDLIIAKKKSAKLWSILSLVVCFILFVVLLVLVLSSGKILPENSIQYTLAFIVGSLIWLFYFLQSERVKNTFVK